MIFTSDDIKELERQIIIKLNFINEIGKKKIVLDDVALESTHKQGNYNGIVYISINKCGYNIPVYFNNMNSFMQDFSNGLNFILNRKKI